MMRTGKIIMACANYWTSPFQVGSHHLAREFVRAGWEVAFVSDPISPLHLVTGLTPALRERYRLHSKQGERVLDGRLWAYVPGAWLAPHHKPLLRARLVHRWWPRLAWPSLRGVLRRTGFDRVDLVYVDSAVHFPWVREISRQKIVYRVCDNNAAFAKSTPAARQMEHELCQMSDLAVYTAALCANMFRTWARADALTCPMA